MPAAHVDRGVLRPRAARPSTTAPAARPNARAPAARLSAQASAVQLSAPARPVWLVAAVFAAVELAASGRYGFHRDELYFLDAGRHLAFGYVDQGPLAPALAHMSSVMLGATPTAIRILPALLGAATVVVTALIAQTLGGGTFAQTLSAVAAACDPVQIADSHLATTIVYDLLGWALVLLFVLRALLAGRERCWLWAGVAAGFDLLNKNLIVLLAGALLIAILLSPWRGALRSRWPVLGVLTAAAICSPQLIWQAQHGWPALLMSRALAAEHSTTGDYAAFIPAQLIYPGLLTLPVAAAGVLALARDARLRFLAVAFGLLVAFVFIDIPGRPYYTAGFYPVIYAAGAVALRPRSRSRRRLYLGAPVLGALASLPLILPLLPLATMARLRFLHTLAYDQGETVGWPALTREVADVYRTVAPRQRSATSIFTSNYGEAGAIALYGPALGLPHPLSGHNGYWLWGPGRAPDATVIAVNSVSQLTAHFSRCRYAATFHSPDGVDNDENGSQIWVCTGPRGPWQSFWGSLRHYG
ncbi:MAG TPA: glycosyltransferase family 39 protein [Solirubrobacteraceae bacterium]|nr:glycosyltransferase family 39 protein [Solirubrobacteraceae bacterium]